MTPQRRHFSCHAITAKSHRDLSGLSGSRSHSPDAGQRFGSVEVAVIALKGWATREASRLGDPHEEYDGHYDAIVLAAAGLIRLGLADRITQLLPIEVSIPACAQGALGIEVRAHVGARRGSASVGVDQDLCQRAVPLLSDTVPSKHQP